MNDMPRKRSVVDQIFGDNKAPAPEVLTADFGHLVTKVDDMIAMAKEANAKPANDAEQAALGDKIIDINRLKNLIDGKRTTEKAPVLEAGRAIDGFFNDLANRLTDEGRRLQHGADDYARRKAAEERARREREAEEARKKAQAERDKAEAAKTATAAGNAEGRAEALEAKAEALDAAASASAADLTRTRVGGVTSSAKASWTFRIEDYTAAISPLGPLGPYFRKEHLESALTSMVRIQKQSAVWPGVSFYEDTKASFRK